MKQLNLLSAPLLCSTINAASAQGPLRFEAETVTDPKDAWLVNKFTDSKWNLWSTDKDAERKWSGGVVLQSPRVMRDRSSPEDGAPPLHAHVKDIPPGKYYVEIGGVGRSMGISLDGKTWREITSSSRNLGLTEIGSEGFEIWVDDRFAYDPSPGPCYFDYLEFAPLLDPKRKPKVDGYANERVEEPFGRGLVALPRADGGIYLGWRLLKDDPANIAFDVYRRSGAGAPEKLNNRPLAKTTDFVDENPMTGVENEYFVMRAAGGEAGKASKGAKATPSSEGRSYVSIPLDGNHTFQKCGIADLNGDGVYDYVLKVRWLVVRNVRQPRLEIPAEASCCNHQVARQGKDPGCPIRAARWHALPTRHRLLWGDALRGQPGARALSVDRPEADSPEGLAQEVT